MTDRTLQNFVNGKFTETADGRTSDVIDPSTGEVYTHAPISGRQDVDAAMQAAANAFEGWRDTTPSERSLALFRLADAMEQRADEIVEAETRNTGKPVALTRSEEIPPSVDQVRFFAGAARVLGGLSAGEYLRDHTSMISSARFSIASASLNRARLRSDGVLSRHPSNALAAACIAASTSWRPDTGA
jgi:betaine-aldehyde dehydrogenase